MEASAFELFLNNLGPYIHVKPKRPLVARLGDLAVGAYEIEAHGQR